MVLEKGQGMPSLPALTILVVFLFYLLYRRALPKPIPGIPYDESARRSVFGNLPDILAYFKKNGRIRPWLTEHPVRHNSPITQFWSRPFKQAGVILSDFQESQDILLRRTKEFDRGRRNAEFFAGIVPNHHIAMRSADPRFKGNKELVKDLMSPAFLNEVGFLPFVTGGALSLRLVHRCQLRRYMPRLWGLLTYGP